MFEDFDLSDLNWNAVILALIFEVVLVIAFFSSPDPAMVDKIPIFWRVAALILALPAGYWIAVRRLER